MRLPKEHVLGSQRECGCLAAGEEAGAWSWTGAVVVVVVHSRSLAADADDGPLARQRFFGVWA